MLLEIPIPRRVWGHPPRETLRLHKVVCEASSSRLAQLFKKAAMKDSQSVGIYCTRDSHLECRTTVV